MSLKVKLCGIRDKASLIAAYDSDYIGFVFYQKSPRFITALEAKKLRKFMNPNQKLVGLFVNADVNLISYINDLLQLDIIQLHGEEDRVYIKKIKEFKKPIIKAIPVSSYSDIKKSKKYESLCDMILFDTKINSNLSGGTGISFDWNLLRRYDSSINWILAGGLNISNVSEAINRTNANFIDISSGVEKSRGIKCPNKIKKFLDYIRKYEKNKLSQISR